MINSLAKIDLKKHREQFPGLKNKSYFNFGGQGTMPQAAIEAILETHQYIQEVGPFSGKINAWLIQRSTWLRESLAEELGTTAATITLTENVTAGCNIALWGIDWQPGDRLLMTDCEHPGVIATVEEIARRFQVEVAICPILDTLNRGNATEVIEQYLTANTRLVVLSHLLWNTGQVLPLKEIVEVCHNYQTNNKPIRVLADAAQSAGSLALNLPESGVDYYAFTGHKWFCGAAGVGGLYISEAAFDSLQPTFIGWRGVKLDSQGQPQAWKSDGQKFEVATSAYPEYEGLRSAIAVHQAWGTTQQRYQTICELSQYLWSSLQQIDRVECLKDTAPEAGLVSFQIADIKHQQLVETLEKQGFFLRTIAKPDCIRACVHYLTLPEEIERLVEAISNSLSH
ncbi:aminotransferase class V-fold PLP-dependent enzyme [Myxosarcina sp. GI1]|uniref:aminotransferase class V-fold PLP-dependent enzyme n=1 Tax=Myxosarcina sp. GI1 TaxID=1541065 RepID=UPI00056C2B36|nr:aminotransferase class V-fold PLP-dependent enzyme [Myxosarcina sp. GI1]